MTAVAMPTATATTAIPIFPAMTTAVAVFVVAAATTISAWGRTVSLWRAAHVDVPVLWRVRVRVPGRVAGPIDVPRSRVVRVHHAPHGRERDADGETERRKCKASAAILDTNHGTPQFFFPVISIAGANLFHSPSCAPTGPRSDFGSGSDARVRRVIRATGT